MNEIYKDIQSILAVSDIHPADCIKINNLIIELIEKNQELKKQLQDASIQIQEMTEQDMWCPSNCEKLEKLQQENKKIKKQLETYEIEGYEQNEELNKISSDIRKYKTQQKEFIKYMNSCIKELEKGSPNKLQNTINLGNIDVTKTILQKYKSIIGDDK